MGKSDGGLLLIIFALFALWLYNSGRATAILAVVKDPTYKPNSSTQAGKPTGQPVASAGGAGGTGSIINCAAALATGANPPASCKSAIGAVIKDPLASFKNVLNAVDPLQIFGIKF